MKRIVTDIEIDAPVQKVWNILLDFERYPEWNPFIKSIQVDNLEEGAKLKVHLQQPDSTSMSFTPKCIRLDKERELRWLGHLSIPGIFDGEHTFRLNKLQNNRTRLIQAETFRGVLAPLLWKQLDTKTRKGFELMNESLKVLAEQE